MKMALAFQKGQAPWKSMCANRCKQGGGSAWSLELAICAIKRARDEAVASEGCARAMVGVDWLFLISLVSLFFGPRPKQGGREAE